MSLTYPVNNMTICDLVIAAEQITRTLSESEAIQEAVYHLIPDEHRNVIDLTERIVKAWNRYVTSTGSGIVEERVVRRLCGYYRTMIHHGT
jgi:hypothetical protein